MLQAAFVALVVLDAVLSQSLCNDCVVAPGASSRWRSNETRTIVWRATQAGDAVLYLVNATEVGSSTDETIILRGLILSNDVPLLNATTVQVVGENRYTWDIPAGLNGLVDNVRVFVDNRAESGGALIESDTFNLLEG